MEHIKSLLMTFFLTHMPELIEQGYVYISYPPLYSVTERGVKKFFLNETEYRDFIIKRTIDKINDKVEKNELEVKVNSKELYNKIMGLFDYNVLIKKLSGKYGGTELFESISLEYFLNLISGSSDSLEEFIDSLITDKETLYHGKEEFQYLNIVEDEDTGGKSISGFFNDKFYFIPITDMLEEDVNTVVEQGLVNMVISEDGDFQLIFYNGDGSPILHPSSISDIILEATPKHRSRYKGLGENNADELRETVMEPKTRLVRQVKIEDLESSEEITDMLFNSNRAEDRQGFIDEHSDYLKTHNKDI